jgi:hypothetical protein
VLILLYHESVPRLLWVCENICEPSPAFKAYRFHVVGCGFSSVFAERKPNIGQSIFWVSLKLLVLQSFHNAVSNVEVM